MFTWRTYNVKFSEKKMWFLLAGVNSVAVGEASLSETIKATNYRAAYITTIKSKWNKCMVEKQLKWCRISHFLPILATGCLAFLLSCPIPCFRKSKLYVKIMCSGRRGGSIG